jgi:hypothetical protein
MTTIEVIMQWHQRAARLRRRATPDDFDQYMANMDADLIEAILKDIEDTL